MLNSSQVVLGHDGLALRQIVRRWCVAAAAASMFYSALAPALGLGEITLHSALEQPFNADIELVDTAGLSADDVRMSLASPQAFGRAGIERLFFLNDLRFTPVIEGNHGVVHVVSRKPVSEPSLSFVVRLARPNGDLLHAYTVLMDPADSPQGRAATRGRWIAPLGHHVDVNMPVAPPQAVQGNHYTTVSGDNLNAIVHRLQGPGSKVPAADLAKGIQALNTQAFAQGSNSQLKPGQSLLLPDIAILPASMTLPAVSAAPAVAPTPGAPAVLSSEDQKTAEQLAANAIENQQLSKTVDDLKGQLQGLQAQVSNKDKQVVELQTKLSELKSAANQAPLPAAVPAPVPVPVATVPVEADSWVSTPLLLGALAVLLLLLGVAWSVRRRRQQVAPAPEAYEAPERRTPIVPTVPVYEVPRVVPTAPVVPVAAPPTPVTPRAAGAATDALDGASIYIAYGRFSEALGVLRDAARKQPERSDLRLRILELLGEQGDGEAFAIESQSLLDHGISAQKVEEIRQRFPQLQAKPAPEPLPVPAQLAPVQMTEAKVDRPLEPTPVAQPADEFHLNLDDLSMNADWDLVDPFETTPSARSKNATEHVEPEPEFASNLTQFPEVFEMHEEQFLSDFAEPDEPIVHAIVEHIDDEFLDSFMNDSEELDLVDLSDDPSSKLHQAQALIDEGEWDNARELLLEVINDADEEHRREAKDLLAGIS
ncbi:MAG: FimV/HubP family polar landmark protein [Pseudomonas sp.]